MRIYVVLFVYIALHCGVFDTRIHSVVLHDTNIIMGYIGPVVYVLEFFHSY